MKTSSPVPRHDDQKCRVCRICWNQCPAETLSELREEKETLRGIVYTAGRGKGTGARVNAPCQSACPLKQDVPAYIAAIAARDYHEASRIIRLTNPLPRTLGNLCEHPCTKACTRGMYDDPMDIRGLKRFAVTAVESSPTRSLPPMKDETNKRVAIVGAGPAGLAAAYSLALKGHRVRLYDSEPMPGGLLRTAVPNFILPREDLDADIRDILALGVEFKPGMTIGKHTSVDTLLEENDAVLLATGAGRQGPTRLLNDNRMKNVKSGFELMKSIAEGERPSVGRSVAVVGGYPEGLACARAAVRLGAEDVSLVFSDKMNKLPKPELTLAEDEGVAVFSEHLVQVLEQDRDELELNLNSTGQDTNEAITIICNTVIVAQGRVRDRSFASGVKGTALDRLDTSKVDRKTMELLRPGIFAAGEAVTGPKSTVRAVASGLKAAASIDRHLAGEKLRR